MKRALLLLPAGLLLGGCLYTDIRSPRAYRSASPAEVKSDPADPVVTGESCNRTYIYLVAVGKSGYHESVRKAMEPYPDRVLYDVKTDIKVNSYLFGVYSKICTQVMGRAGKL